MPVCVENYTWTQTESTVRVHVPCKSRKVHIVSTDEYLKAHFPPFLFEAFLFEAVDDSKSKAEIGNGAVVFTLQKRTSRMWEHLMVQTKGTEEMRKLRERALQEFQQKVCEESRQKAEKRREYKEFALQTMMGLEWTERDTIQKNKDAEREKTTAELEAWQQRQKALEKEEILNGLQRRPEVPRKKLPCPLGRKPVVNPNTEETKVIKELPQRPPGNIRFTFTPRAFPTALRESQMAEEEEYLRQQAEARGAADADIQELTDLTAEERNPDWLKDKGDKCFKVGDYMGALNAYSLAIKINKKIPALFSNRAACHLKLNHLPKAVKDASQALVLLTLTDAENTTARLRPTVRRGTAFCLLQRYERGLQDYEAALEIDPHNQALQADTQSIRDIIQNSSSKQLQ
ncbi:dynein assembly factor 4, axonemal [Oryzias melastigma]|uniref:Dynein axonemal assembly factor 4 n=1 Tax=Oryzias melastigma TaxID=30732 RepID=A0A3B3DQ57_ORYME|nr:dynein assembly factor 4, axonemal [Oryzias melastigma]